MPLPSYSDLADEVKAPKIENNILKDKIKTSKQLIKVLVQRHDKFAWKKKLKLIQKVRFHIGITSVTLFNTLFTLIKPCIPHITYWKGPKHAMRIFKGTGRKNANIIKPI